MTTERPSAVARERKAGISIFRGDIIRQATIDSFANVVAIVAGDSQIDCLSTSRCGGCQQEWPVAVANLSGRRLLIGKHEFVAGRQHGDAWPRLHKRHRAACFGENR